VIHLLYDLRQPVSIARKPAVILNKDVDLLLGAEFCQPGESIGS